MNLLNNALIAPMGASREEDICPTLQREVLLECLAVKNGAVAYPEGGTLFGYEECSVMKSYLHPAFALVLCLDSSHLVLSGLSLEHCQPAFCINCYSVSLLSHWKEDFIQKPDRMARILSCLPFHHNFACIKQHPYLSSRSTNVEHIPQDDCQREHLCQGMA